MIIQSTFLQWICKCVISCVNMIIMIIERGLDCHSDPWKTDDTYNSWKHTFMLFRNSRGNVFFVVCTKSSIWKIPADTVLLCFDVHQYVPRSNGAHLDPQCWIYQPIDGLNIPAPLMDGPGHVSVWAGFAPKKHLFTDPHCQGEQRSIAASFLHITTY